MGELVRDQSDLAPSLEMVLDRTFTRPGPVSRAELLRAALTVWAPAEILTAVQALPDRTFNTPDDVARLLVLVPEMP
ncbi:MAG: DUF2795 domain-containing protein [Actinomycetota bacterium]